MSGAAKSGSVPEVRGYSAIHKESDVEYLRRVRREEGVLAAIKLVASKLPSRIYWRLYYAYNLPIDRRFDRKHGIETSSIDYLRDLTIDSPNVGSGLEYEPTPVRAFSSMLKDLPSDLSKFVFVDFGCGKGRTLLLASSFNFKKIIGVEFARELYEAAVRNVSAYEDESQKCRSIEPVHIDAAQFEIPDDPCVFYFYYPFREDVMKQVLDNIDASYRRNPRPMYFINRLDKSSWRDVCARLFGEIDFLRVRAARPRLFASAIFEPISVVTYETVEI